MKWAKRRAPKITHIFRKQTLVKTSLVLIVALFGVTIFSSLYTPSVSADCTNPSTCGGTGGGSSDHQYQVDVYVKYDPSKSNPKTDTITLKSIGATTVRPKTVTIRNNASHATFKFGTLDTENNATACSSVTNQCAGASFKDKYAIVNLKYNGDNSTSSGNSPPAGDATSKDNNAPECGSDNSNMSWLICPVYNIVATATNSFDNLINKLLHVNTDVFKAGDRYEKPYYTAWSSFRNIALIFIIIAGVVMVIAQATGARAIDAYTIKRVMPRLLFAAIAITLSWIVLIFLINISNVVGEGVQALIYGPFNSLSSSGGGNGAGGTITGIGELGILSVIGVPAYVLTGGGLLSFIAVAGIAILVGLLVVVLRQILVVFLLIIAPLAIAAYVLPNTQKMAHEWWDWFFRALLMFPLITGFIAVGKVFSLVALNQSSSNPAFGIVAIIAYVLPYFLLPFTFKMAGGAMGTLAQGVHGIGKKAQGSGMMGQLKERTKEKNKLGTRFGRGNTFTRGLSDLTQAGARPGEWVKGNPGLGRNPKKWGRNWRGNLSTMRDTDTASRGNELAVKDPMLDRFNGDNAALWAGYNFGNHHSRAKAQEELLRTKYGGKSLSELNSDERGSLDQDLGRISMLYKSHGEAAQLAFLNKNSQDNNGFEGFKDANGNVIPTAQKMYDTAVQYGGSDENKVIRTAMMLRANQARAGRGDGADVNAGALIPVLKDAMKSGHFTAENATVIGSTGLRTKDVVEQVRENPKAVKAKFEYGTQRINQITQGGRLSLEDIVNNDRANETDYASEFRGLLDAMQGMQSVGQMYGSADVNKAIREGLSNASITNNGTVQEYFASSSTNRGRDGGRNRTQDMLDDLDRDDER